MRTRIVQFAVLVMVLAVGAVSVVFAQGSGNNYVGVEKCKNCHNSDAKGNQYGKWKDMKHAKAYETLATDKAKEFGKARGVDDPQKSDKCLKCHETAFDVPADKKDDKFDPKGGIQCESCHGPGGLHVKTRLAAAAESDDGDLFGDAGGDEAYTPVPEGEIIVKPKADACEKCHNQESPTFNGEKFNYDEMVKKIAHPDPRKKK